MIYPILEKNKVSTEIIVKGYGSVLGKLIECNAYGVYVETSNNQLCFVPYFNMLKMFCDKPVENEKTKSN